MIDPGFLNGLLSINNVDFFTGVPDSLLKNFCAWVTGNIPEKNHIIAVNEGAAIAMASGYHLATGKIPLVYMQNSGIGNAVNPLLSLADEDVYKIPVILLVGWRGEPGVKDEPQHLKQGKVTCALFDAMKIPYLVLSDDEKEAKNQVEDALKCIKKDNTPYALIVKKDTFAPYTPEKNKNSDIVSAKEDKMSREEAIEEIVRSSSPGEIFVSTTGMASRELYELRDKYQMDHEHDFLTVGSMGHASSLALILALQKPALTINCVDGDGAVLMHLGALPAIAVQKPANLRHFVLNNGAHDSVGGQPTIARKIDLPGIARSSGYANVYSVSTPEELRGALQNKNGPVFIEVKVRKGNRKDLGRPKSSPQENKEAFMRILGGNKA